MKLKIKDGGPAFPTQNGTRNDPGMSLRDWFAGQAINAFILHVKNYSHKSKWEDAAISSYLIADAMLMARTAPSGLEN